MNGDSWLTNYFAEVRPRILGALLRKFGDLALAEDAFSEACLRAIGNWEKNGRPDDPFAWLLLVSRNVAIDMLRKSQRLRPEDEGEAQSAPEDDTTLYRDNILRLLFICCHPDLSPQDQAAIALRVVVDMSVAEISTAFVTSAQTMERRISRAKSKISASDVPFDTPGLGERARRLDSVMLMIYLMFNEGWSGEAGPQDRRWILCLEAIRLLRLLLDLFPDHKELQGLLAMCLSHYARRRARFSDKGTPQTLEHQDRSLWDAQMICEADQILKQALGRGSLGPFQIKAALALAHASAPSYGMTNWSEIDRLYQSLLIFEPTPVVHLNHIIALGMLHGPCHALDQLDTLADDLLSYRWFHTARAGFLMQDQQYHAAEAALGRALMLHPNDAERAAIHEKIAECQSHSD